MVTLTAGAQERRSAEAQKSKTNNLEINKFILAKKNYKTTKCWDFQNMLNAACKLFNKIHKRKHLAHHNHEIHFLNRELSDWIPKGIQSLIDGTYTPRHLERVYFNDGAVDQLYLPDRIFQNIILNQIKPTFSNVMSRNCYHLKGPHGVKLATEKIRQILQEKEPNYIIRADIKSFYASIPHYKLVQDINKAYDDPKLTNMLKSIITNPIETVKGYKNPIRGIALRGPLSQFLSGLYLKPLDDAFDNMEISYLRYQDDIIILCKTKRQLNRCKQRMMEILYERGLKLSKKKTRIGTTDKAFHFLGIHYPGTQLLDYIKTSRSNNDAIENKCDHDLLAEGSNKSQIKQLDCTTNVESNFLPHERTLRKARMQVNIMVYDGLSANRIKNYLHRWVFWWLRTAGIWKYDELLTRLIDSCWANNPATTVAVELLERYQSRLRLNSIYNTNESLCCLRIS